MGPTADGATRGAPARTAPATTPFDLRRPTRADGAAMWELAQGAVDQNSPYAYLLCAEYFADSCIVAADGERLVGFVTGFRPPADPSTQFVWQIVVGPEARGSGLASRMLDALIALPGDEPMRALEATVNPSNEASQGLFRSFARRRGVACSEDLLFGPEHFPAAAGDHEAEIRFRIGPL